MRFWTGLCHNGLLFLAPWRYLIDLKCSFLPLTTSLYNHNHQGLVLDLLFCSDSSILRFWVALFPEVDFFSSASSMISSLHFLLVSSSFPLFQSRETVTLGVLLAVAQGLYWPVETRSCSSLSAGKGSLGFRGRPPSVTWYSTYMIAFSLNSSLVLIVNFYVKIRNINWMHGILRRQSLGSILIMGYLY